MFNQIQETSFLPYWRNETSGKLAEAVIAYFDLQDKPTPNSLPKEQIELIKSYLLIWVNYPGWRFEEKDYQKLAKLQRQTEKIENVTDINKCIDLAFRLNIDPF